jgi:aspartate/methionine/tyrosine aminotransferase
MIIGNSQNNPTSKVFDDKTYTAIVDVQNERRYRVVLLRFFLRLNFVNAKSIGIEKTKHSSERVLEKF